MIGNLIGITLITHAVLAQLDLKPDVSFTENNDRFDLTGMMNAHPSFRDVPLVDDGDDEMDSNDDFRRRFNNDLAEDIDALRQKRPEANIEQPFLTRRDDGGFAYDDRMDSKEGGGLSEFEESLKAFEHHIEVPNRRRRDTAQARKKFRRNADEKVLSQYGFPVVMTVDGFLKHPGQ